MPFLGFCASLSNYCRWEMSESQQNGGYFRIGDDSTAALPRRENVIVGPAKVMPRKAAISLIFFTLLTVCNADESVIEYARVQKAQSLSGVIRDQLGAPIPQVEVDEMSADWSAVLQHTVTDGAGHWALPVLPARRTHSIRFLKPAFHQLRLRVQITRRATKPLDFKLPVS
jgi:hypothetical protein